MNDGSMQPYALTLDKFISHAAKWHPNAEVVTRRDDGGVDRVGYVELKSRSLRISAILQNFGIRAGDRVATLAWNTQAHVEVWYAIMGMGAVCHTLNPRLDRAKLATMIAASAARILVVSADLLGLAQDISHHDTQIERLLVIDALEQTGPAADGRPTVTDLESLIAAADAGARWGNFDENTPCGLCFTSGTTGAPKGVTYTHRSSYLHTLRLLQADVVGLAASDSVLTVVPMFHANAWGLPFAVPAVGAKLVLPGRRADGASLAHLIRTEAVTIAVGVPTVWLGLLEYLETNGGDIPTLKRIVMGGAGVARSLMEKLERQLGVTVQTSWGMTELSPSGTVSAPYDIPRSAELSGRPAVGLDLLLTDADGKALIEQRNVEGHLRVRGASVVERYFGEEHAATDADGWFPTGDLARIDERGNLSIVGRAKDLIKSGGEWINPAEIEAIVGALAQVSLAAVIGRTDPKWGERPILLVEMRGCDAVSDESLLAPLHGRVAPWWIPDAIVRLPRMPLAATGKIDKQTLRERFANAIDIVEAEGGGK